MDKPIFKIDFVKFGELRELQAKTRSDCHAAFTAVPGGCVWPFANLGNTDEEYRECNLYGLFPFLDELSDLFLQYRPEGGRFFISKHEAWFASESQPFVRHVYAQIEVADTAIRAVRPKA